MTENEAIEYLSTRYLAIGCPINPPKEQCEKHNAIIDMAITALEEIQQYRAIGTVEECREAVERMKPKTPKNMKKSSIDGIYGDCPCCGGRLDSFLPDKKYCSECGQRLDWEE